MRERRQFSVGCDVLGAQDVLIPRFMRTVFFYRCFPALQSHLLTPHVVPHTQALQGLHQRGALGWCLRNVCCAVPLPLFRWGYTLKVLVGSHMVVKQSELLQYRLQRLCVRNKQLTQQWFERAKQSLHAPVLPGRAALNALVAYTGKFQEYSEHLAGEHSLIVRAQSLRFAIPGNGQAQVAQQRPAAFIDYSAQVREHTRTVV